MVLDQARQLKSSFQSSAQCSIRVPPLVRRLEPWWWWRTVGGEDVSYFRRNRGRLTMQQRIDREIDEYVAMKKKKARIRALTDVMPSGQGALQFIIQNAVPLAVPGPGEVALVGAWYSGDVGRLVNVGLWGSGPAAYRDPGGSLWSIGSSGGSGGLR